jgi:hypothetical protein
MKAKIEACNRSYNMGTEYGEYTADIILRGKVFSFAGTYTLPEDGPADISVSMHTGKGWRYVYHEFIYDIIAAEIENNNVVWNI